MLEKIEYKGYTIEVWLDDMADSPRVGDNLGVIYSNHREYYPDGNSIDELIDEDGKLALDEKYCLKIYAYIPGGISRSTSREGQFADAWDSGLFGIIAVDKDVAAREFPVDTEANTLKCLETEVELLDNWYNNECYGYTVTDAYGEELMSVGGYIGDNDYKYMVEDAKDNIDAYIQRESETKYVTGKATVTIEVTYKAPVGTSTDVLTDAVETLACTQGDAKINGVTVSGRSTTVACHED